MSEESLGPHRAKVLSTGNVIRLVNKGCGEGVLVPEADKSFSVVPLISKKKEIAQRSPAMSGQSNLLECCREDLHTGLSERGYWLLVTPFAAGAG